MALIKLKNGTEREFDRVEIDTNGNTIKAYEDHREVDSFHQFHVAFVSFDDGLVYLTDEPNKES